MIQIAREQIGMQRLQPLQQADVEAGHDHAVDDAVLFKDGVEVVQRLGLVAGELLDLDVDDAHILDHVEHLLQRGGGQEVFRAEIVGMEFAAEVVLGDLGIGHFVDLAGAVRGAVDGLVMTDDEYTVLAQMDVALNAVGIHIDRHLKGGQRVFRRVTRCASVSLNHGHIAYASVEWVGNSGHADACPVPLHHTMI